MNTPAKIRELRRDPERLNDLSPREFEEVVAELLASFGYEVSLTSATRDGGYDILAISRDYLGFETSWAVECKRYSPKHRVGLEALERLYGVKLVLRLSQALLVTTSRLTSPAKELADTAGDIKVADREVLLDWIARYRPPARESSHVIGRRFQSCFLSYSHEDGSFATKLVARLRREGVRVWFAAEDLSPGQKIHEEVAKAINSFDRLLVILSENSIRSSWVQSEVRKARRRELRDGCRILFPVTLVPFDRLKQWELFDTDLGQDLAVEIREYLIPDFSNWSDSGVLEEQVQQLLEGLRSG